MTKRSKAIQWLTNSRRRFTVNNEKSYRLVLFKTLQKEKSVYFVNSSISCLQFFCLRLRSSSVQWPLVFNFCPQETRNLCFFIEIICWALQTSLVQSTQGSLQFFLEHSHFERKPLVMSQIVGQFLRLKPTQGKWVQHC